MWVPVISVDLGQFAGGVDGDMYQFECASISLKSKQER